MAHDNYRDTSRDRMQSSIQGAPRPDLRSRGQAMLERIIPASRAPAPPPEVNPFQKALDDYDRVSRDLMVTKDALLDRDNRLTHAYNDNDALKARIQHEGDFFRGEITKIRAERDALSRIAVELASTINAIGEAAGTVINLTIKAQEIAKTYKARFQEAEALNNVVDELDIDIRATLKNAGVKHEDRETAETSTRLPETPYI